MWKKVYFEGKEEAQKILQFELWYFPSSIVMN